MREKYQEFLSTQQLYRKNLSDYQFGGYCGSISALHSSSGCPFLTLSPTVGRPGHISRIAYSQLTGGKVNKDLVL
jgi:hypothetical protein